MNTTISIVPHAPPELRRYMILREISDALDTASDDAMSLKAIIATTRISSRDVVREFGDASGLISTLAEMLALSILGPLDICTTQASFLAQLQAFGRRVVDGHSAVRLRRLFRVALAEAARDIDVGRTFYGCGPSLVVAGLDRFFKAAHYAGLVPAEDSHGLAGHFMACLGANQDSCDARHHHGSNGLHDGIDVDAAVGMFWAGIQMDPEDALAVV